MRRLSTSDAAALLGRSPQWLRMQHRDGALTAEVEHLRNGRTRLWFDEADLRSFGLAQGIRPNAAALDPRDATILHLQDVIADHERTIQLQHGELQQLKREIELRDELIRSQDDRIRLYQRLMDNATRDEDSNQRGPGG